MLYCPNCNHALKGLAPFASCTVCGAQFGEHSAWAPTAEPQGKPWPVGGAAQATPQDGVAPSWSHTVAKAVVALLLLLAAFPLLYLGSLLPGTVLVIPGLVLLTLAIAVAAVRSRQATTVLCVVSLLLLFIIWRMASGIPFAR